MKTRADLEPGQRLVRASRRASTMAAAHERARKSKKRATTANDSDDEDESREEAGCTLSGNDRLRDVRKGRACWL